MQWTRIKRKLRFAKCVPRSVANEHQISQLIAEFFEAERSGVGHFQERRPAEFQLIEEASVVQRQSSPSAILNRVNSIKTPRLLRIYSRFLMPPKNNVWHISFTRFRNAGRLQLQQRVTKRTRETRMDQNYESKTQWRNHPHHEQETDHLGRRDGSALHSRQRRLV